MKETRPPRTPPPQGSAPADGLARTLIRALRASPALGLTIAGGVALHFVLGAAAFDQLWFVRERGFERAEVARLSGWIGMLAGVLGKLFGGGRPGAAPTGPSPRALPGAPEGDPR